MVEERRKDPVSRLVMMWKMGLCGVPKDDKVWDKVHWGRCSKSAKNLLMIFNDDIDVAADCMAEIHERLTKADIVFTLETVCRHAYDWRAKHDKPARSK